MFIHLDPDFGSDISLESLKDRLELVEFEKEESKIWHDEQRVNKQSKVSVSCILIPFLSYRKSLVN